MVVPLCVCLLNEFGASFIEIMGTDDSGLVYCLLSLYDEEW